jgi:tRNA(adenine34) deaminase
MGTDATVPQPVLPPDRDDDSPASGGTVGLDDGTAMGLALAEAAAAVSHGDVPVGAVAVADGRVIASRHNEREQRGDPTAHAELLALSDAADALGTWRLSEVTLVVTLEPCPMCAGGLVAARVGRLVFGAADAKAGACGSLYNLCADPRLNHEVAVTAGIRAHEASEQLSGFFADRRGRQL